MSREGIVVVALTKAKAGQEQRLKDRLLSLLGPSRSEPGCREFLLHQGETDGALFASYEVWSDPAAFQNHLQMPYMKQFMADVPALLAELDQRTLTELGIGTNPDLSTWMYVEP
jgi:quinol monooxygenase YgiN